MPENLLESELFGYEEGAFTGAKKGGRPGLFEFSHKGTLFLDEVEGMSQALQVKLLRVLQEREIMRVGGNRVIKIDVRIVAATNESLEQKVEEGTFRRDLYYRLNTLPIVIPTLAERGEDMFLIIESIKGELGGDFVLTEPVKDFLRNYSWPGNIRELRNIVEYFIYTGQPEITIEELPPTVFRRHSVKLRPVASSQPGSPAAPASPWAAVNPPAPASPWAAANPTAQSLPPVPETASPPGEKEFSPFWYILEQLYRASEGYTTIGRERILAGAKAKNLPLSQQIRRKRQVIKFTVCLVPSHSITDHGMQKNGAYQVDGCDQKAVEQGMPEIRDPYCLGKIFQAPFLGQGQDAGDAVGHFTGLFKSNHNSHV